MTLNASGAISLGGSTTGQSVELELGQSGTAAITLNDTVVRTLAAVPSGTISLSSLYGKSNQGSSIYATAGTYSWICPAGVTSVCIVAIGAGSNGGSPDSETTYGEVGGAGGACGWVNNVTVVPGNSYTVVVGAHGSSGGDSYVTIGATTYRAGGGVNNSGTTPDIGGVVTNMSGGSGGQGGNGTSAAAWGYGGGGGAGGYSGAGGNGGGAGWGVGPYTGGAAASSSGGAGGGSGAGYGGGSGSTSISGTGGGVGIYGIGSTGGGSGYNCGGYGGSGGQNGNGNTAGNVSGPAGAYGGGGSIGAGVGADGAVRILWGAGRAFPGTNVGSP